MKSQRYGEPEEYVVWVGQGERGQIVCNLWDMESPLPLEPVADLADGAIFRVNAVFDSAGARQAAYEQLVSGEPAVRSDFDVYLREDTLIYVKEPCSRTDVEAMFFLHLYPVDVNDLPDHRRQYGFDNLDFDFDDQGVIIEGKCLAEVPSPGVRYLRNRDRPVRPRPGGRSGVEGGVHAPAAPLNPNVALSTPIYRAKAAG